MATQTRKSLQQSEQQASVNALVELLFARFQKLYLSVEETAGQLGIAAGTLRNMMSAGIKNLPLSIIVGGRRLFSIHAIAEFMLGIAAPASAPLTDEEKKEGKEKRKRGRPRKADLDIATRAGEVRHG